MKRSIVTGLVFLIVLMAGCNTVGETSLTEESTWKLVETKVSIGGPAEFTPADREEFIVFLDNNQVRNSNGWCGEGEPSTVVFSEGVINTDCNGNGELKFEIDGDVMILHNPMCIEACEYKYEKVKN